MRLLDELNGIPKVRAVPADKIESVIKKADPIRLLRERAFDKEYKIFTLSIDSHSSYRPTVWNVFDPFKAATNRGSNSM